MKGECEAPKQGEGVCIFGAEIEQSDAHALWNIWNNLNVSNASEYKKLTDRSE